MTANSNKLLVSESSEHFQKTNYNCAFVLPEFHQMLMFYIPVCIGVTEVGNMIKM